MVKSVLGVNHQGLTDWKIQRVSAIVLAIYTIGIVLFLCCHREMNYDIWRELFAHSYMKIATMMTLVALLYHAWIGMWTIVTDYIKSVVLSLIINTIILTALIALFFAGLLIFWGV